MSFTRQATCTITDDEPLGEQVRRGLQTGCRGVLVCRPHGLKLTGGAPAERSHEESRSGTPRRGRKVLDQALLRHISLSGCSRMGTQEVHAQAKCSSPFRKGGVDRRITGIVTFKSPRSGSGAWRALVFNV